MAHRAWMWASCGAACRPEDVRRVPNCCITPLAAGQVIDGLDQAVMKMKEGERALVTSAPTYAFGDQVRLAFDSAGMRVIVLHAAVQPMLLVDIALQTLLLLVGCEQSSGWKRLQPPIRMPSAVPAPKHRGAHGAHNPGASVCLQVCHRWPPSSVRHAPRVADHISCWFGCVQDSQQAQAVVPAGSTVEYDVKLLSFVKVGVGATVFLRLHRRGSQQPRPALRCPDLSKCCWVLACSAR